MGRPAQTPHEHASAAVLACGPGAALSHTSALAHWGIAGKLEDTFRAFCHEYDLPEPLLNAKVNGYEVDAYFPDHNLIVELDGWA